jgi:hypothetical protein
MTVRITDVSYTTITPPFSLYHARVAERHVVSGSVVGEPILSVPSAIMDLKFLPNAVSVHYRREPGSAVWTTFMLKARGSYARASGVPIGYDLGCVEIEVLPDRVPGWLLDFAEEHRPDVPAVG